MKVQFRGLLPAAEQKGSLAPDAPVANFEVEGFGEARVLAWDVSPFRDVEVAHWAPNLRARALMALCRHVREVHHLDRENGTLALSRRFEVAPDRDEPNWRVQGFTSVQTADLKVIKHVLGIGASSPAERDWWANRLSLGTNATSVLAELERHGCEAWKALEHDRDPDAERPIALYAGLSRAQKTACLEVLAPLRERYLEVVAAAMRAVANLQAARHAHLGGGEALTMHFLDRSGLVAIARGRPEGLSACTAFLALSGEEKELGPLTLRKRWNRLVQDAGAVRFMAKFHSPEAWKQS